MAGHTRPLTVACVLRSGGVYDGQWVMKLKRGVARHISEPHEFVCLTDMAVPCETRPLRNPEWKGWWSKINLFSEFKEGRTLYFDLDTVVVGSLDAIARHAHTFTMAHEYYRPHMMCSTAMAWDGDYSFISAAFAASHAALSRKYDQGMRPRIGDQAFIEDQLKEAGVEAAPPQAASAVAFHGRPKPNDISHGWVPQAWR